jgi:ATP-dependent DNA helicase RecG
MSAASELSVKLDQSVEYLPLVGPKRGQILRQLGISTVEELLGYFPRTYLDRSTITPIAKLVPGETTTAIGTVMRSGVQQIKNRTMFKVLIKDDTGYLNLNWFHGSKWLQSQFKEGDLISVSGKVDFFRGPVMTHPDFDFLDDKKGPLNTAGLIPVYPLNQSMRQAYLNSRQLRRIFFAIFQKGISGLADPIPEAILHRYKLMPYREALEQIHLPDSSELLAAALFRFKFQELFMYQLVLAVKRHWVKNSPNAPQCSSAGALIHQLYQQLPFELTEAQKRVVREIYGDLQRPEPMQRLLQGDVGSGKTVVAALVAAIMVANGYQTAIMAPTEILAEQHNRSFQQFFAPLKVRSALIIGNQRKSEREALLAALANGEISIVIGTHALIQDKVTFHKLGLVIIDEQHRFGVDQRGALIRKGVAPHMLAMTATPIPRTLSITLYGDMDISVIDQMPSGRQPVSTKAVTPDRLPKVYDFIKQELQAGRQAYIVYPLISESQVLDLEAAEKGFDKISRELFSEFQVALLHGKTPRDEKDETMRRFLAGEIHILVSTTVIEVGVNVPNATIMLIENAERFGLTQLHQLRGRVGRGAEKSYCILISRQATELARLRLRILENESNGFVISEEDLKLRGPGDYFSYRQHGDAGLKVADLMKDSAMVTPAREAAFSIVEKDPQLLAPQHQTTRKFFLKHYKDKLDYATIG